MEKINVIDKVVMKPISEIKPYIRNPRKNSKTIEKLCEIIPKVGFNQPLLIDKKGVIVKGHSRFAAAVKLGIKELPCVISENSDEQNNLDRIADNKIAEFSEWDKDELAHELDMMTTDLDFLDFDLPTFEYETMNFQDENINEMDEEKKAEYMKKLEEESRQRAQITNQKDIDKAYEKQDKMADEITHREYYRFTCTKCGAENIIDKKNIYKD